jgi:hypothetical protein
MSRVNQKTGVSIAEIERLVRVSRDAAAFAPVPVPARQAVPVRELSPLQRELLGHLFFASVSDQLDLSFVTNFITTTLEMGEPWLTLAGELMAHIATGLCPAERPIVEWASLTAPGVENLLNSFRASEKAYSTDQRSAQIAKIAVEVEIRGNQQAMKSLKANLYTVNDDQERRQILQTITDMSRQQIELEKRLR